MKDPKSKNEFCLKLSGKAFIPQELEIGRNYKITADGTITTKTESDNNDGTHTIYFKFEPVIVEIQREGEKTIKAKDTRKDGQLWRSQLWMIWKEKNEDNEFDEVYKIIMRWLRFNAEWIYEKALKDLKNKI